jgi:predicted metalloprotease with PDZ domain
LPPAWSLATSFGTSADGTGRCQSYTGPWGAVHQALFAAGDFRIHRFLIGQRAAALAVRGQWTFTDDVAIADIQKVVGIIRDFWHDDSFPYFLVTLKPYDRDGSSDGSAFTNAFWLYMSPHDPFTSQLTQLSHEAFHAWDPRKMGALSDAQDSIIGWFHEGFTQYYAELLVYRAHLMPLATYVDNVNRDLRDFPTSSSPYIRGRVVALWLDAQIRAASNDTLSLDNLMFDMVRGAGAPLTQARILETAERYLPAESRGQLARMIEPGGGEPTSLARALTPCVSATIDTLPTFDIGFDLAASRAARRVSGVVQGGPAYRAGLRDGQAVTGFSVYNNQPDRMAKITVQGDTGSVVIAYYPRGASISVPQLHIDTTAYASHPVVCHAS